MALPLSLGCAGFAGTAHAIEDPITLDFEFDLGEEGYTPETNQYSAQGVTITGAFGLIAGLSLGDPGNWGIEGTNGSSFLGQNALGSGEVTVAFDGYFGNFSMECSRSQGSAPGSVLTATAYDADGNAIDSDMIHFGDINAWASLDVTMVDAVRVGITVNDESPWGCDNMVLANLGSTSETTVSPETTIPESTPAPVDTEQELPATGGSRSLALPALALALTGILTAAAVRRRHA